MKAALISDIPSDRFEIVDVAQPRVGRADEVLVRVEACGICGTDLHIVSGHSYRPELPFVLGHEPVGRVVSGGAGAAGWEQRRVSMTLFERCSRPDCVFCAQGDERLCPDVRSIVGVRGRWGGFADYLLVPAAQLVAVPDGLTPVQAACLVDAGATAMNVARVVNRAASESAVVVGAGPVGFLTAEFLRVAGREPLVVESNEARRDAAAASGLRVLADIAHLDQLVDCIVECSGSSLVPPQAVDALAPRGLLVLAGYSELPRFDLAPVARKELTIRGTRSGSRADLEQALELADQGRIRLPEISTWTLDKVNAAFEALRSGAVAGKAVVLVDTEARNPN